MKKLTQYKKILLSILITFLVFFQIPAAMVMAANNTDQSMYERIVDPDTSDTYTDKLINGSTGSKNAGRVWSDKSVFTEPITLDYDTDGVDATLSTDEDFLHAYSLLGSSQLVNDVVPLDVMFVMDISQSMATNMAIELTVSALNNAISQLLSLNPASRFGITVYSSKAATVLDLGSYSNVKGYNYVSVSHNNDNDFTLTYRVHDNETDEDISIRISNSSSVDHTAETKEKSWDHILTDYQGYDYVINGEATNIQAGIKAGLEVLAQAEDTTVLSYMGNKVSRIPAMILMTDGAANTMANFENIVTNTEIPEDHHFVDVNGAVGSTDLNFTTFDLEDDFGHSSNYFPLYKNKSYSLPGDEGIATVNFVKDDTPFHISENDSDPIILSTLLTASYYTSAVNKHYHDEAVAHEVSNLNNVKLQSYSIFAYTNGNGSTSETEKPVVDQIMNPQKNFNSAYGGTAYSLYQEWATSTNGVLNKDLYTYYSVMDLSYVVYAEFYANRPPEYQEYEEALKNYNKETDGDYTTFDNTLYTYYAEKYSFRKYGANTIVKSTINMTLSDAWLNNPANNPYNVTAKEIKSNINYLPSKNAMNSTFKDIESVFSGIIDELNGKAFLLTSGTNSLGVENSVTYMDPIGEYMEIKDNVTVKGKSTSDMVLLLNGNLNNVVKTAIYDYQFNNTYQNTHPDLSSFKEGWYKGDDPETAEFNINGSWEDGYIYRVRYDTAISFIPTLKPLSDIDGDGDEDVDDLTSKQKQTVYTLYRFDLPNDSLGNIRRAWRINPSYLSSNISIDEVDVEKGTNIITKDGMQDYLTSLEEQGLPLPEGVYRLSDIRVWVEDTQNYKDLNPDDTLAGVGYTQAIYVNVPADAVPAQIVELSYNERDQFVEYKTNLDQKDASTPLRLFYSVGVTNKIKTVDGTGIDLANVDKYYLDNHKEAEKVYFLANYYSANKYDGYEEESQRSRGDPLITFSPEIDNRYYIFQDYTILYTKIYQVSSSNDLVDVTDTLDVSFQTTLKTKPVESKEEALELIKNKELKSNDYVILKTDAAKGFNEDSNYFTILEHYIEDEEEPGKAIKSQTALLRSGKEFTLNSVENVSLGDMLCWYNYIEERPLEDTTAANSGFIIATKPGAIRVGRMSQSRVIKGSQPAGQTYASNNKTKTANNYFLPTLSKVSGTGNDVLVNIYLGNDGRLEIDDTLLFVTNLVAAKDGDFATSNSPLSYKEFDYQVFIQGFEGQRSAIKVLWDEKFKRWRRRISTIDVITDNQHFLQDNQFNQVVLDANGNVYTGQIDENNSSSLFYAYIKDLGFDDDGVVEEPPSNNSNIAVRVYSAPENGRDTLSGFRTQDDKAAYFNATNVYLIPINEVLATGEDNWVFNENLDYKLLESFPIAYMFPEHTDGRTNGMDLESQFAIKSEYLTVNLDFGTDTLFDDNMVTIVGQNRTKFIEPKTLKANTTQFTLKHGEGLLFNTIPSGTSYRVTEKLNNNSDIGWSLWESNEPLTQKNAESALKVAVKEVRQDTFVNYSDTGEVTGYYNTETSSVLPESDVKINDTAFRTLDEKDGSTDQLYSLVGSTGLHEEGIQYVNTTDAGILSLEKTLSADTNTLLNENDLDTVFNFNIAFTYPEETFSIGYDDASYSYQKFNKTTVVEDGKEVEKLDLIESGRLVSSSSEVVNSTDIVRNDLTVVPSKANWTISLKADQVFKVYGLLLGSECYVHELSVNGFSPIDGVDKKQITIMNKDEENLILFDNQKENPDPTSIELSGDKTIIGLGDVPKIEAGQYNFLVELQDPSQEEVAPKTKTVTNDSNGNILFFSHDEKFSKAGVYTYLITELSENLPQGVSVDPSIYKIVITIEEVYDNDNKKPTYSKRLNAQTQLFKVNENNDITYGDIEFENTYSPAPTTLQIEGTKKYLLGEQSLPLVDGEFEFELKGKTDSNLNPPLPETDKKVSNDSEGRFVFGAITYTEIGEYYYEVSEVKNTDSTITYDQTVYTVKVTVSDNNGQLEAIPEYFTQGDTSENETQDLVFTNTRHSGNLVVEKEIEGSAANTEDVFSFEVELSDKSINTVSETPDEMEFKNGIATFSLRANESKTANNLPSGIQYIVTEIDPGDYTSAYSNNAKGAIPDTDTVTVTVTNRRPGPVTTSITGQKTLVNQNVLEQDKKVLEDGQFSFTLRPSEKNPKSDPVQKDITVTNNEQGSFSFDDLQYSEVGRYLYTISEEQTDEAGFVSDTSIYNIEIDVSDDQKSETLQLNKSIVKVNGNQVKEPLEFTNYYIPEKVSVAIEGEKVFENGFLTGNDFEFVLRATDESLDFQPIVTSNDIFGHFIFDDVIFDSEGTYTFEVYEVDPEIDGVEASNVIYEVTIEVKDNKGTLEAKVSYSVKDEDTTAKSIVFTNIQETGDLEISKIVTGTGGDSERDFDFKVQLDNTLVTGNYGDLTFVNGLSFFTLKDGESLKATGLPIGTSYTVSELNSEDYQVVTSGETGKISNELSQAQFENHKDAKGDLEILKTVIGTREDKAKTFNFILSLYTDEEFTEVAQDINGSYGDLIFTNGVAKFTLKDSQSVKVIGLPVNTYYEVEEGQDTNFETRSTKDTGMISEEKSLVEFTNERIQITPVTYPLGIQKIVEGNPTEDGQFTFSLALKDGNDQGVSLPDNKVVTITGSGTLSFDDIIFTEAGKYIFTVSEINIPDGYFVDVEDHEVTIVVEELNKTLVISQVLVDNDQDEIIFTNTYGEQKRTRDILPATAGIVKLHAEPNEAYHTEQNEVIPQENIWYMVRVINNSASTIHNLVIYDPIPDTLELTGKSYVTVHSQDDSPSSNVYDLSQSYKKNLRLIKLSQLNGESIDLEPNDAIDLEYEATIPSNIEDETYWTNHAWCSYDELTAENQSYQAQGQLSAFSLDPDNIKSETELINFNLINFPIELEGSITGITDYHSLYHDDETLAEEVDTDVVKYSNDVQEHLILSSDDPDKSSSQNDTNSDNNSNSNSTNTNETDQTKKDDTTSDDNSNNNNVSDDLPDNDITPDSDNDKVSDINEILEERDKIYIPETVEKLTTIQTLDDTTVNSTTTNVSDVPNTGVERNTWIFCLILTAGILIFILDLVFIERNNIISKIFKKN